MGRISISVSILLTFLLFFSSPILGSNPTYSDCKPLIDATILDLAAKAVHAGELPDEPRIDHPCPATSAAVPAVEPPVELPIEEPPLAETPPTEELPPLPPPLEEAKSESAPPPPAEKPVYVLPPPEKPVYVPPPPVRSQPEPQPEYVQTAPQPAIGKRSIGFFEGIINSIFGLKGEYASDPKWAVPWNTHPEFKKKKVEKESAEIKKVDSSPGFIRESITNFVYTIFGDKPKSSERDSKWAEPWQTHKEHIKAKVSKKDAPVEQANVDATPGYIRSSITELIYKIFGHKPTTEERDPKWAEPWQTHKEHIREKVVKKVAPAEQTKIDATPGYIRNSITELIYKIFGHKPASDIKDSKWAEPWQTHKEHIREKVVKKEAPAAQDKGDATPGFIRSSITELIYKIFGHKPSSEERDPKWAEPWQTHKEHIRTKVAKKESPAEQAKVDATPGFIRSSITELIYKIFGHKPTTEERDPKWSQPWQTHEEHMKTSKKPLHSSTVYVPPPTPVVHAPTPHAPPPPPPARQEPPTPVSQAPPPPPPKPAAPVKPEVIPEKDATPLPKETFPTPAQATKEKKSATTKKHENIDKIKESKKSNKETQKSSEKKIKGIKLKEKQKKREDKFPKKLEETKSKTIYKDKLHDKNSEKMDKKCKKVDKKSQEGEKKSQKVEKKSQKVDKKSQKMDRKSQEVEKKSQKVDKKSQKVDKKSQQVVKKSENVDKKSQEVDKKSQEVEKTSQKVDKKSQTEVKKSQKVAKMAVEVDSKSSKKTKRPEIRILATTKERTQSLLGKTKAKHSGSKTDKKQTPTPAERVADAPKAPVKQVLEEVATPQKETEREAAFEENDQIVVVPSAFRSRDHIDSILGLDEASVHASARTIPIAEATLRDLKKVYDTAVKPLETTFKYQDISNRHLSDAELFGTPLILMLGPYSTGKSTFINYLLGVEFTKRALKTGTPPSHGVFRIIQYGEHDRDLDGTDLTGHWSFGSLQKFGQNFVDQVRGKALNIPLLKKVTFVEAPGILEMRRPGERLYPFNDAVQWFIDRADLILVMFDYTKLDAGYEMEAILDQLKGREAQTRILLNKADQVPPEELMKVQGSLFWNLSPILGVAAPPSVYAGSFTSLQYRPSSPVKLFQAQEEALLHDVAKAINARVDNRIAITRRHAVRVRNHAQMVDTYLKVFYTNKGFLTSKHKLAEDIIENPHAYNIYEGMSLLTNISRYDLPDAEVYRDFFRIHNLYDFRTLRETCTFIGGCPLEKIDAAINKQLPELMERHRRLVEAASPEARLPDPTLRSTRMGAGTAHVHSTKL